MVADAFKGEDFPCVINYFTTMPDFELETSLWQAVVSNNLPMARELLEAEADPDFRHEGGKTVVHQAVLNRHVPMLELLAEYTANFDMRDEQHMSALDCVGAHYDDEDESPLLPVLHCLLKHDADPMLCSTIPSVNQTLYWAAYKGFTRVVSALLQYEVDPRVVIDNVRASQEALNGGYPEVAALLIRFEAFHARVEQPDFQLSLDDVLQRVDVGYTHILERAEALNIVATSMSRGAPRNQLFGTTSSSADEEPDVRSEHAYDA